LENDNLNLVEIKLCVMPKDVKEAPVNIVSLHNDYFQYFKYLKMEHAVSRYSRVAYSSSMHCDKVKCASCESIR